MNLLKAGVLVCLSHCSVPRGKLRVEQARKAICQVSSPEECFTATLPWGTSPEAGAAASSQLASGASEGEGGRLEEGCACNEASGGPKLLHLDISGEVGPGLSCFSECDCDTIPVPRCHLVRRACRSPGPPPFLSSLPAPSPGDPVPSV